MQSVQHDGQRRLPLHGDFELHAAAVHPAERLGPAPGALRRGRRRDILRLLVQYVVLAAGLFPVVRADRGAQRHAPALLPTRPGSRAALPGRGGGTAGGRGRDGRRAGRYGLARLLRPAGRGGDARVEAGPGARVVVRALRVHGGEVAEIVLARARQIADDDRGRHGQRDDGDGREQHPRPCGGQEPPKWLGPPARIMGSDSDSDSSPDSGRDSGSCSDLGSGVLPDPSPPAPAPTSPPETASRTGSSGAGAGAGAGTGTAAGAGAGAAAGAAWAGRRRAASATIHRRCSSTSSSGVAAHNRASRSTGAYSFGTASPLQYRCSVDVLTCSLPASTP